MALHNVVRIDLRKETGLVYAIVTYYTDDGTFKASEEYQLQTPTPAALAALISDRMRAIQSSFIDPAAYKALFALDNTEIVPVDNGGGDNGGNVPADPDLNVFILAYRQLQAAQDKVTLGILDQGDKTYTTLLDAAKAAFKPEYAGIR